MLLTGCQSLEIAPSDENGECCYCVKPEKTVLDANGAQAVSDADAADYVVCLNEKIGVCRAILGHPSTAP
jgi:hypothetical protein